LEADRKILKGMQEDLAELHQCANRAQEAIERGEFEEAERLATKIRERWPDLIHGPRTLANLRSAQGRWADAADAYALAIGVIEGDREGFDDRALQEMKRGLEEARSKSRW
jgi:hypothetical protein